MKERKPMAIGFKDTTHYKEIDARLMKLEAAALTRMDQFAMRAMQAYITNYGENIRGFAEVARASYQLADAMEKERIKWTS